MPNDEKIRVLFLEEWKPIEDDRIKGEYFISNAGRVKNKNGRILSTANINNSGYQMISFLSKKDPDSRVSKTVHRMVASAFVPNDSSDINDVVNHKDGNKMNNHASNLEWTTHAENTNHALTHNLMSNLIGENQHMAKLTNAQVVKVCELLQEGNYHHYKDILQAIGMEVTTNNLCLISNIKRRIAWTHISKDYKF